MSRFCVRVNKQLMSTYYISRPGDMTINEAGIAGALKKLPVHGKRYIKQGALSWGS